MSRLAIIYSFAFLLMMKDSESQSIFNAIIDYDTSFVKKYIQDGGSIDAVDVQKLRLSKRKRKETSITILEHCIGAIRRSKEDITYDNTIKAYRNLDLCMAALDKSSNRQKHVDRLFNLSIAIGDVELSRKIYNLGAGINTKCNLCYGRTPILIALGYNENIEMLKFLLSLKPDLTIKDKSDKGFIHYACQVSNFEMVQYYVKNKLGDLNEQDSYHNTPLDYAASNGNYELFNYLISNGAKYDYVARKGHTVLHSAAESANPDFFRHVHLVTGLPLWNLKNNKKDVIAFVDRSTVESESIYQYIVRYTIETYGYKYYTKRKKSQFIKKILS